jgi:hypothetical protein
MARFPTGLAALLALAADAIGLPLALVAFLLKRRLPSFEGDASEGGDAPRVRVAPAPRGLRA